MAATYWRNADPVGKRLQLAGRWTQVVGVVRDVRSESLLEPPHLLFYVPLRQNVASKFGVFVVSSRPLSEIGPRVGRAIASLDRSIAAPAVLPMRDVMDRSTSPQRIAVILVGLSGAIAVFLAAVGLYGVMTYVVSQSTREFGLRMALGAAPAGVLRLVLSRGLGVTMAGIAAGAATALGTTPLMGDLLYGVSPRDPLTFLTALTVMLGTAFVACLVPGLRAARTDLVTALRA